ncbi:uncharacterized protein LOC119080385 [Bradysia coprophila]|uniref:uncharacterized protein LOC119080385 n=1 Tax=Bradysia coprophila TaxID=38358 RepID=UPI00187DC74A|nr:uncharacterized protein LOC119080385 [Bradysia coprophila]
MILLSVFYNLVLIYMIGYFFYVLLFTGKFDQMFETSCIEIVRNLPILVPLNLFWLKGYRIQNCVASFDHFTLSISRIYLSGAKITAPSGCRLKLLMVYALLILAHAIHYAIEYYQTDAVETLSDKSSASAIWSAVFEYSSAILMTLFIPIYCTFCWAVNYQLELFFEYVNVLINIRAVPTYEYFDQFKRCYRKIADDIMFVNQLFALYLSVVMVIVGQMIYGEASNLGMRILSIVIEMFTKGDDAAEATVKTLALSEIRLIVGAVVIVLLYIGLFGFTYWQAVLVNDNVRYLHVWINDFVTEPASRLPSQLFEGFTLLKWYIHSRLEQERPALLNIMLVNVVPFLATRLRQYRVKH